MTADSPEGRSGKKEELNPWVRLGVDMGPLLVFFIANAKAGIFWGTGMFMAATAVSIAYSWHRTRHVPRMLWITGLIVLVFGSLTLYLADERFIKLKPTIVNLLFAGILFSGLMRGRHYLKYLFETAFPPMTDRGWTIVTRNWGLFFLSMAIINEIVWRNFSTDVWVAFKAFGFLPLSFLFALSQVLVMQKHLSPEPATDTQPPDRGGDNLA